MPGTWGDLVTTAKNRGLIRKSLDALVLKADNAVALPATLVSSSDGSLVVPTGYKPLGWHSDDGLQWAREVELSELSAHGSAEAVRTDTRRVNNTLEVTALETNIETMGMSIGLKIAANAGTVKELVLTEPSVPKAIEFRCLALSVDDTDFGEIYTGKLYAAAKVTATSPGAWTDGDSAQSHGFTISAHRDSAAGWSVRHFIGGPGFAGLRTAMGFTAPA